MFDLGLAAVVRRYDVEEEIAAAGYAPAQHFLFRFRCGCQFSTVGDDSTNFDTYPSACPDPDHAITLYLREED